jgi:N-acetylneuraminic acid mutarotase
VAAAANVPPARAGGGSWIDASGSLWLFGGDSLPGFLNDLWKFTPSTNQWTWESGSSTPNAFGVYGTQSVAAAANVPGARAPAASWTDAAGNFWLFGGGGIVAPSTSGDFNDLWIFSPASGQWSWVSGSSSGTAGAVPASPMPGARAAAASWVDAAGNFWLFGGESPADPVAGGELNDLWEYRQAD